MNRGLLEKSLREGAGVTVLYGVALVAFETLLAYVLPTFHEELQGSWLRLEFVQGFLEALFGAEVGSTLGPEFLLAFPWVHPVILAVLCAHATTLATRVPAAEVERGTIDFLLGLPVTRLQVYVCDGVALLIWGVALTVALLLGNRSGTWLAGAPGTEPLPTAWILVNALALYLAVGGLAKLVSAFCSRRGHAVAVVLVFLLASFLVHLLAQFWEPLRLWRSVCVLGYYQPIHILRSGAFPLFDVLVLIAVGVASWGAGARVFTRRDILTL